MAGSDPKAKKICYFMAKDPAINWYFDNWSGGTRGFNRFQKGCYIDLLEAQFQIGHLSLDQVKNILGADFSEWKTIKKKFIQDNEELFFNERLEVEIIKRQQYSQRQKERVNKRWDKYRGNTVVIPVNETGTETVLGKENMREKPFPKISEVERVFIAQGGTKEMALAFFNKHSSVGWIMRGSPIKEFSFLVGSFITNWNQNLQSKNAFQTITEKPRQRFKFT